VLKYTHTHKSEIVLKICEKYRKKRQENKEDIERLDQTISRRDNKKEKVQERLK
jgi:hypothetical protein